MTVLTYFKANLKIKTNKNKKQNPQRQCSAGPLPLSLLVAPTCDTSRHKNFDSLI